MLAKFNNLLGLSVIGYAPKSKSQIDGYEDFFSNYVAEGFWITNRVEVKTLVSANEERCKKNQPNCIGDEYFMLNTNAK
ncbi:hypothetical protein D3C71_1988670 [compost metagenome]